MRTSRSRRNRNRTFPITLSPSFFETSVSRLFIELSVLLIQTVTDLRNSLKNSESFIILIMFTSSIQFVLPSSILELLCVLRVGRFLNVQSCHHSTDSRGLIADFKYYFDGLVLQARLLVIINQVNTMSSEVFHNIP